MDAFQHAVNVGVTHLETDVRLAEDGILYLHHRATSLLPNRPLNTKRKKSLLTLEELFSAFPNSFFAIDPKHNLAVEPLAKLIVSHGLEDRVCIGSSFETRAERTADLVEQLSGKRPRTALVGVSALTKLLVRTNKPGSNGTYIHVPSRFITKATVRTAHSWGLRIIAWVLNDEDSIQKALSLGIDGFMTDFPEMAMKVIG